MRLKGGVDDVQGRLIMADVIFPAGKSHQWKPLARLMRIKWFFFSFFCLFGGACQFRESRCHAENGIANLIRG